MEHYSRHRDRVRERAGVCGAAAGLGAADITVGAARVHCELSMMEVPMEVYLKLVKLEFSIALMSIRWIVRCPAEGKGIARKQYDMTILSKKDAAGIRTSSEQQTTVMTKEEYVDYFVNRAPLRNRATAAFANH